ncbi:Major Facilitator Superfamily protein [Paraburkholderia phenazinium]|jgi:DHA1 family tetracycline resistance protein-like MFS transporter|uniref:Major Facilitator Superfamily protein n=1 Tax=Paraburkholderia phenazinium TaxID=60549 RepID=A0A1G8J2J3_9BURK|nr:Major Facilitator Superfamily protein [Paraburkholderia phenazinium]
MAGCQGIAQAAITDMSTPENKAYNMSIMSLAFSAGVIVGPVLGGVTSDRTIAPVFNYGRPFLLVAALSAICAIWTWRSYRDTALASGKARVDLMLLQTRFHYTSSQLGLFSGLIGVCFVLGLLVVVRLMLRIWSVVDIAKTGLLIAGVCQILSTLFPQQIDPAISALAVHHVVVLAHLTKAVPASRKTASRESMLTPGAS